jgi:hypothetical protein
VGRETGVGSSSSSGMSQHMGNSTVRNFGGLDVRGPAGISLSELGLVGQLFAGVSGKAGLGKNEF